MSDLLVSIIIPIYGVEKHIEKCAMSVLSQTYPNIEIIFVNDNTNDNSMIILNEVLNNNSGHNKTTKIINHEINRGLAVARNTGIEHATGEYVFHLDSDDYINIDAIQILVEAALINNADIVFAPMTEIWAEGKKTILYPRKSKSKNEHLLNILYRRTSVTLCGNIYKKKLFDQIKLVPSINYGEDYATLPKIVYISEHIAFTEVPVYNYIKTNEDSYTANISAVSIDNIISAYESIRSFFLESTNNILLNHHVRDSFYTLKAQVIKSTKGDINLLITLSRRIEKYKKKYPRTTRLDNLILIIIFDLSVKATSALLNAAFKVKKWL